MPPNPDDESRRDRRTEALYAGLTVAGTLLVIGVVFAINPGLLSRIESFLRSLRLVSVFIPGLLLPAPSFPGAHVEVYAAVAQFALGIGILQVLLMALRILAHSPTYRKARTASSLVFWLGASYLVSNLLNSSTNVTGWFLFWTAIVMLAGVSLVVRAIVLAARV